MDDRTLALHGIALDAIPLGVLIANAEGDIVYANDAFLAMTGYARAETLGRSCRFLQGPHTDPQTVSRIHAALQAQSGFKGEILNYRKDGSPFWNEVSIAPVRGDDGTATHFIGTAQDVSDRVRTEQAIRESEQRLQLALLGGSLGMWDWRVADGQLTVNARWKTMLGLEADGPAPSIESWNQHVHPEDRVKLERMVEDVILNPAGREFEAEVRARRADGRQIWILDKGAVVERSADGRPVRVSGTHLDITERKEADANMHQLAYFDPLTGLPNRRMLLDRVAHALASAQRSHQVGALMLIDLDNFKHINDARGHSVGDALLQQVAQRLEALLRAGNTVARLGGDEFVVLLTDLDREVEIAARLALGVAERVREALVAPFVIGKLAYNTSGSIGITLFPKPGDRIDDLLREADTAMYRSKSAGRNRVAFFESGMHAEVEQRLAMEHGLKEAVDAHQFEVHAQPKVDARGREIGCELLLRWTHPVYGNVSPVQFIPISEASGQIQSLGDWVIDQACRSLVRLQAVGCKRSLAVNVSPRQFHHDGFVERVRGIVRRTGAPASGLIFEVTEGLLIENWEATAARMAELVALGIRFSIDDFGTGYSSLAYLKRLPLYELKIDRSFVQDIPADASDRAIVQSILSVAHHLQLHVVAEGVETQAQARFLRASDCQCMQGYLFGRPRHLQAWLSCLGVVA